MSIEITFKVLCYTNWGDKPRIVGRNFELGLWDPYKALVLQTSNEDYPYWLGFIKLSYNKD